MWVPPSLSDLPSRLIGPIAIDSETKDPGLENRGPGWAFKRNNDEGPVGFSLAAQDFRCYLPFGHEGGGNLDRDGVMRYLTHILSDPYQDKVFANNTYDLGWMKRIGLPCPGKIHDVLVMAPLIDENRGAVGYNLDAVARDYLGVGKDEALLEEGYRKSGESSKKKGAAKKVLWKMHSQFVGPYAEQDAQVTLDLFLILRKLIDEQDLNKVYNLEMEVSPVLIDMRWRGVRVDLDKCEILSVDFKRREDEFVAFIKNRTGIEVSLTSSSSKASVLRAMGHDLPKTKKTGKDSVTAEVLKAIIDSCDDPVTKAMGQAIKLRKAREDFIVANILEKHEDGRVYATFNQLMSEEGGTVGGRFSSSKPNLQNQYNPEKEPEIGTAIRGCWLPEPGELWASVDYASQEPRLTAHYAYATSQKGAEVLIDRYRENPRTDFHQFTADLAGITRKRAKAINLGLNYGMGESKLCHELGLPTEWCASVGSFREKVELGRFQTEQEATQVYLAYCAKHCMKPSPQYAVREVAGKEGTEILTKYHTGLPFLRGLIAKATEVAKNRGYVTTIGGRRCRFPKGPDGKVWYTHKALNRIIQGSAADMTKKAMVDIHRAGHKLLLTVHDENCCSVSDLKEAIEIRRIMEAAIPISVPILGDLAIGPNWGQLEEIPD